MNFLFDTANTKQARGEKCFDAGQSAPSRSFELTKVIFASQTALQYLREKLATFIAERIIRLERLKLPWPLFLNTSSVAPPKPSLNSSN